MQRLYIPEGYSSHLTVRQTEHAIKKVKDFFERDLAIELNLTRVSAPIFVDATSGLNDTLNGVERPVDFSVFSRIVKAEIEQITPRVIGNFDRSGSVHYDMLSALQKSIRGSDPDAAIFYLAKILEGGDLIGACRRLQVIASEDIGLAYPQAAAIVRACTESAFDLGLPEASIPLSNAALLLATAPKSNSAHAAYEAAREDVLAGRGQALPPYLRPSNRYDGYKYPHDYENHYVEQQYLPDDLKSRQYYRYGENKTEQAALAYWQKIKKR